MEDFIKIKLEDEDTKRIILEALDEHNKKLNAKDDPTIGHIFFSDKLDEKFKILAQYFGLYFLLLVTGSIFNSIVGIDYSQLFISFDISKIIGTLITVFILLVICSTFGWLSILLYDLLVVKYTKFTRVFTITTILITINNIKPLEYFIGNFINFF